MDFSNRIKQWFGNDEQPQKPLFPVNQEPATALEERQRLLAHHVRLVTRGMSNGLCVYGSRGGLGKTKIVLETLREERVQPVILTGHCTPLSLYSNLYHNPNKIIFLDDVDSLFRNLPALGILRAALWGERNERRLVTYNSSQLKIPASFYFTGRIIFTANVLPKKNHAFSAVLSRVDQYELDASNEEVVEMMKEIARQGFDDLSVQECLQVVDFIAGFAATRELSLRLLEPSYRKVIYSKQAGVDWRDLVQSQLEEIGGDHHPISEVNPVDEVECLRQIMEQYPHSIQEQVEMWRELTKKSRATYFRLKKKLFGKKDGEEKQ